MMSPFDKLYTRSFSVAWTAPAATYTISQKLWLSPSYANPLFHLKLNDEKKAVISKILLIGGIH